ncbi:hypothetical protein CO229_01170 [Mycoplasmopsis bovirhinis]|uniref:hypothetical protein n=1 Tax=Mycoplasmopsis bovirhinis TaxID=29553 RepID=UPI000C05BD39|nr:hypothetical protein [Mycoplasmopsis bovirhinis]ATO30730.1 hypothetical protein CO229_01170 [Mycoplasmopsis bovirhinis]
MLKKINKRRVIKYSLLAFFTLGIITVPSSLWVLYTNDRKKQDEYSKIAKHSYWNSEKNIWTIEGVGPQVFLVDKDKIDQEDKKHLYQTSDFIPGSSSTFYLFYKYNNYLNQNDLHQNKYYKYKTEQIKNTSYLFKSQSDFAALLKKNQSNYYTDDFIVTNKYKELLDSINFETHDLLMLNNYSTVKIAQSDNRELQWNITDFNFDNQNNKIQINFKYNDKLRKFTFFDDTKTIYYIELGADNWYKTYFLIIPKSSAQNANDLEIKFEYK